MFEYDGIFPIIVHEEVNCLYRKTDLCLLRIGTYKLGVLGTRVYGSGVNCRYSRV